jgi:predicted RNase H-like nuclease (RuvC/YqgF family)
MTDTVPPQNSSEEAKAKALVEKKLLLIPFFERHEDHILSKLEECDEIAEKARKNKDMIFFAESLPIIDGLIQVGTTRDEYKNALKEVGEEWGDDIAANVISTLTFLYVAEQGRKLAERHLRKKEVWDRITARVKRLEPES